MDYVRREEVQKLLLAISNKRNPRQQADASALAAEWLDHYNQQLIQMDVLSKQTLEDALSQKSIGK